MRSTTPPHFTRAKKDGRGSRGRSPRGGACWWQRAVSIWKQGGRAEPNLVRATAILAKADKSYQPILGTAYNYLGLVRAGQKRHAEADSLYKRALGVVEKALGRDHANLAPILDNHAETLVALNRSDDAGAAKVRAINIRRKTRSGEILALVRQESYSGLMLLLHCRRRAQAGRDHRPGMAASVRTAADAEKEFKQAWPARRKAPSRRHQKLGNGLLYRAAQIPRPARHS